MSDQALAVLEELNVALWADDIVRALGDEEADRRVREAFARLAEPDFEVHMWAPAEIGGTKFHGTGADGFRQVWTEWIEPFESFQPQLESRHVSGDKVVDLVKLTATTRTGRVPIEQHGAAVWTIRDGKIARVDFHLNHEDALKAAGIDPDRP